MGIMLTCNIEVAAEGRSSFIIHRTPYGAVKLVLSIVEGTGKRYKYVGR